MWERKVPVAVRDREASEAMQGRAGTQGHEGPLEIMAKRVDKENPVGEDPKGLWVIQDLQDSKGRKEPVVIGVNPGMLELLDLQENLAPWVLLDKEVQQEIKEGRVTWAVREAVVLQVQLEKEVLLALLALPVFQGMEV